MKRTKKIFAGLSILLSLSIGFSSCDMLTQILEELTEIEGSESDNQQKDEEKEDEKPEEKDEEKEDEKPEEKDEEKEDFKAPTEIENAKKMIKNLKNIGSLYWYEGYASDDSYIPTFPGGRTLIFDEATTTVTLGSVKYYLRDVESTDDDEEIDGRRIEDDDPSSYYDDEEEEGSGWDGNSYKVELVSTTGEIFGRVYPHLFYPDRGPCYNGLHIALNDGYEIFFGYTNPKNYEKEGESLPEANTIYGIDIILNNNDENDYCNKVHHTLVVGKSNKLPARKEVFYRNPAKYAGYIFTGWSTTPDGNVIYNDEAEVNFTENTTLYAIWRAPNQVTIKFNANGGSGTMESITANEEEEIRLPDCTFTSPDSRKGFLCWSTSESIDDFAGSWYTPEVGVEEVTLYAIWKTQYTVSFDANGGSGTMESKKVFENNYIYIPYNTFVKENHMFAGWATTADGEISYKDNECIENFQADLVLYAVWISGPAGEGTKASPYLLATANDFVFVNKASNSNNDALCKKLASAYYKLTDDIDLTGYEFKNTIGNYYNPFKGVLDGDGHKISNYKGPTLFWDTDNCLICNLIIENADITDDSHGQMSAFGLTFYGKVIGCQFSGKLNVSRWTEKTVFGSNASVVGCLATTEYMKDLGLGKYIYGSAFSTDTNTPEDLNSEITEWNSTNDEGLICNWHFEIKNDSLVLVSGAPN